jgi:hypothetical protein
MPYGINQSKIYAAPPNSVVAIYGLRSYTFSGITVELPAPRVWSA